jgi:hypothetical protein
MEHEGVSHLRINDPDSRNVLVDVGFTKFVPEINDSTNVAGNCHQDIAGANLLLRKP